MSSEDFQSVNTTTETDHHIIHTAASYKIYHL